MKFKNVFSAVTLLSIVSLLGVNSLYSQTFDRVQTQAQKKLEQSIAELGITQESIAKEKIPLATKLNRLEAEVAQKRETLDRLERLRDSRDLNLSTLKNEVKTRRNEMDYAKNLLVEFITNQNASTDASERQLYEEKWIQLLNSADASAETDEPAVASIKALIEGVELGIERLNTLVGGHSFEGNAILPDGTYKKGTFLLYGPQTYFTSIDKSDSGVTQQGASGEPRLISLANGFTSMADTISNSSGPIPLDATLGKALAMETTKESISEHIQKGGLWIYPILGIAFLSLIIAFIKFFELLAMKTIPKGKLVDTITAIQAGDEKRALEVSHSLGGTAGDIIEIGIKNIEYDKDVIEQSLEEVLMRAQPRLERLLSVIWITAATAPLLGLLGTVTGIINTFKLLTIFGSGDPKALGGGISEALITTEFGLIVAIPALVLHALLLKWAKSKENEFESDAMTLLNGILRSKNR